MAISKPGNKAIQVGGFNVWWDDGDQIHMQLNEHDPDLPKGALWVTFSSNPESGNYHPRTSTNARQLSVRTGNLLPNIPFLRHPEISILAALNARTEGGVVEPQLATSGRTSGT